ncbi:diguanylate cyclase [Paenibacillus sp. SYP-B3998]|uniref:Diguanylate cyclase n=1 Tax=Paenibacillus sp. SYP-B3998 TaxID=2678564 RepID=A0A6G3ZXI6_9BACL|nr:diguanylate cyclase [Paenibacillus sp. SYP-B3998]NEW06299.1 diguanylate cyclase [Paenibacillus sp. SYP-B3998]
MHHALTSHYNMYLVLLSFTIALLASYTSLNLAKKMSTSQGWHQKLWILYSSIAMGVGLWAMHFISLLSYPFPSGITYHIQTVMISLLLAIIGPIIGFFVTFRSKLMPAKLIISGTFMGFAISAMHYIGMASLREVTISYLPVPFTLSIFISILASMSALYITSIQNLRFKIGGILMGVAVTAMHYIGMSAAVISYPTALPEGNIFASRLGHFEMAMFIAFGTILLLAVSLTSSQKSDQRFVDHTLLKASILDSSLDSIMMFNHRGWIIEFNPAAEATFGCSRKDALGRTLLDFLFPFDQDGRGAATLYRLLTRKDDSIYGKRVEMTAYRSDRTEFPAEITITGTQFAGKSIYTANVRDLTEIKQSETQIKQLANYDLLTNLPNRSLFGQLFLEAIANAKSSKTTLALLSFNLDNFKLINDTYGHSIGDQVLQKFSALLSTDLKPGYTLARLNGDEFVILMPQENWESTSKIAENVIEQLTVPLLVEGHQLCISTSIGIALYPIDGQCSESLLKKADSAMHADKLTVYA